MNKYVFDFVDDRTGLVLETWEMRRPYITSREFKNITHNLFMYAAIGCEWGKLTAYVYKNNDSCFCIEAKTISDGNTITADIYVNTRYVYTKTIAS